MLRAAARLSTLSKVAAKVAIGLAPLLVGCEKSPPEPAVQLAAVTATPASLPSGAASPATSTAQARPHAACIRKLPASAPPPPRYSVDPACPKDPAGGSPMVPMGHVAFPESKDAPRLDVELMLTNDHQERGMMYRRSVADDKGMLFAWSQPTIHSFWMHNTCIPLDMLFIDRDGFVAGIVENAPTLNDDPRSIDCPTSYVLEVSAGWSRKHGVLPGQHVDIDGVPLGR